MYQILAPNPWSHNYSCLKRSNWWRDYIYHIWCRSVGQRNHLLSSITRRWQSFHSFPWQTRNKHNDHQHLLVCFHWLARRHWPLQVHSRGRHHRRLVWPQAGEPSRLRSASSPLFIVVITFLVPSVRSNNFHLWPVVPLTFLHHSKIHHHCVNSLHCLSVH